MRVVTTQLIDLDMINQVWLLLSARADQNAALTCACVTVGRVGRKQEPLFSHFYMEYKCLYGINK